MNIETSIDCLPAEMICEILKNLNLNDLIQCKLVSKRWYSIVTESSKIIKLIVDCNVHSDPIWYYSNELVNSDLQCKFNLFQVNLKRKILSNLKYLKIDHVLKFDFNQLNLLTQLIHLEINCLLRANHLTLNLLELEILKIYFNFSCHLTIECPKLKILHYVENFDSPELIVKYPESIKDLESRFHGSKLIQFKNVEYLKCVKDFDLINENTLSQFKKLKVVYFNQSIDRVSIFLSRELESNEQIKLTLSNFLGMIKKLRMFDLKVFCFGLQITDHNINQIDFDFDAKLNDFEFVDSNYFYAVNYKYLQDSLPFVHFVDYTRLVNLINPIPTDYFKKFFAISQVSANGKLDQAHFLWFLKNLKVLKRLNLSSTNLTQSFYDELPTICSLFCFQLDEEKNEELDFNFLIQFNELNELSLKQELSLELVKSFIYTFERLNHLKEFKFKFKGRSFVIKRNHGFFNIRFSLCPVKLKITLNEVISYFEKFQISSNYI